MFWQPWMKPAAVFAQSDELTPQKVIATGVISNKCYRLEVWNVGSAGGDQYKDAKLNILDGADCANPNLGIVSTWAGTFDGGSNGTARLNDPNDPSFNMVLQFQDGKTAQVGLEDTTSGDPPAYLMSFKVENPQAFQAAPPPAAQPTPAKGCSPSVGGLSGLKPDDTLSP